MEDLLYYKDLYESIKIKDKPSIMDDKEWEVQHRKVIVYIKRWMYINLHEHICDETRVDVVWQSLKNLFAKKTVGNRISLLRRLVNLKYKDSGNIVEHISLFRSLANKLIAMKINIDDEMQGLLLLNSLPESWETYVVTICNSTLEGTLTIDMVKDSLLNEDARRKEQGESFCERSHSRNPHSYRGRSKSRRDIKCFHYNKC